MAAPLIAAGIALVRFGPAIVRVAKKELANWVKKGGKEIKKPTVSQKRESIVPSQLGKQVKKPKGYTDAPSRQPKTPKQYLERQPKSKDPLDPAKDLNFVSDYEDIPFSRGGSVKGRPAKRSAENS